MGFESAPALAVFELNSRQWCVDPVTLKPVELNETFVTPDTNTYGNGRVVRHGAFQASSSLLGRRAEAKAKMSSKQRSMGVVPLSR